MKKEIATISYSKLSNDYFYENFWLTETPVIITGCPIEEHQYSPDEIIAKYKDPSKKQAGWYDAKVSSEQTPDFINAVISTGQVSQRENAMRVFMQPKGHQTLLHYDGNSLSGFNLLVTEKKEWIIISPNTPMRNIPFMYLSMTNEITDNLSNSIDYYKFMTEPGDLLFLPRYWQHQVTSKANVNINFNWVMTPKFPNQSITGKREAEIIKLRLTFPIVNKAFFPEPIAEYGGEGAPLIERYTKNISQFRIFSRLIKEIFNYIPLVAYYHSVKTRAYLFVSNNFNT